MEASFATFQQSQPHNAHHSYPSNQNNSNPITSPTQQPVHQAPTQQSPLMAQAGNPYAQHPGQSQGHQQIAYNPGQYGMQPYHLSASQAAAMATAAASGPGYYPIHQQGMGVQDAKVDARSRHSPPAGGMQQNPRRMSHVGSPIVQNNRNARHTAPIAQPIPANQDEPVDESPLYVNAKQFHRILKRRIARQKLEEQLRLTSKARKPYLHESRHNHAMRRPRGPGGRFLTSEEVAALERKEAEGGPVGGDVLSNGSETPAPTGSKRKAGDAGGSASKKAKGGAKVNKNIAADDG